MSIHEVDQLGARKSLVVENSGGEAWWFLGTLAIIRIDGQTTGGRFSLIENLLPKEAAPPRHTHPQDETFVVLDGDLTVWVSGQKYRCGPGSVTFAPAGTVHTFFVHSETARMLTLSTPAGIEQFVRMVSDRAKSLELPPDEYYPPKEEIDAALAACEVEVFGPPPLASET